MRKKQRIKNKYGICVNGACRNRDYSGSYVF